jgi:proteasome lid subunit RPN8/RPN11
VQCRSAALKDIIAHAREARPAECCGVLIGREDEIVEAVRIRNLAEGTTRYFLDPKEHIDARRAARMRGLDVLGFYHSHPLTPAEPSATDAAEATYANCLYLIVGLRQDGVEDQPEARLFKLVDAAFVEVALAVT